MLHKIHESWKFILKLNHRETAFSRVYDGSSKSSRFYFFCLLKRKSATFYPLLVQFVSKWWRINLTAIKLISNVLFSLVFGGKKMLRTLFQNSCRILWYHNWVREVEKKKRKKNTPKKRYACQCLSKLKVGWWGSHIGYRTVEYCHLYLL